MQYKTEDNDMPMGLAMALAQNINAMIYFAGLPRMEQQVIINRTHQLQSREELQDFVSDLAQQG